MRIYSKSLLGLLIASIAFGAGYLYTNVDRPLVKKSEIDEAYQLGYKSLIVLSNGLYKLDKAMPWEKAHEQSEILAQLLYLNTIADQFVLNLNKLA